MPNFVPPLERYWYNSVSDGWLVDRPEKSVSQGFDAYRVILSDMAKSSVLQMVVSKKLRPDCSCAGCGNGGKRRQLNEVLPFRTGTRPVIALCNQCLHWLRYADAKTLKWFRDHRDRLISGQGK